MNDIKQEDEIYCPNCAKPIKKDFAICPYCRIEINKNNDVKSINENDKKIFGTSQKPQQQSEGKRALKWFLPIF